MQQRDSGTDSYYSLLFLPMFVLSTVAVSSICVLVILFFLGKSTQTVVIQGESEQHTINSQAVLRDKKDLLDQLTYMERAELRSQVHFVSDLIRATGSKAPAAQLAHRIVAESTAAGFDPLLTTSIILSESSFRPKVVSHAGAIGLMQLRPTTARYIARRNSIEWRGNIALKDPAYNIKLGIAYFSYLEDLFEGDRHLALIAYNWGPTNLNNALRGTRRIPNSPRRYAKDILSNHQQWAQHYSVRKAAFRHVSQTPYFES